MLTKVEVYTARGDTLELPLEDTSSGFVVKDIEGLGPVKASIVSSKFAQIDGSTYQASRRENRNVLMTIGIEVQHSSLTVSERRNALYEYLMPKTNVTLRFYIDGVHFADLTGMVESFEASLFSKEPQVVVSIISFDPDFVAPSSVVVNGSTVEGTTGLGVVYSGTVDTGFVFKLFVNRTMSGVTLHNTNPEGALLSFEFIAPMLSGDVLEIRTISGSKRAYLTRLGTQRSILYGVSPVASWFGLYPGTNSFRAAASGLAVPYTLEYLPRYGGL